MQWCILQVMLYVENMKCTRAYQNILAYTTSGQLVADTCFMYDVWGDGFCVWKCSCTAEILCDHYKIIMPAQSRAVAGSPSAWKFKEIRGWQIWP